MRSSLEDVLCRRYPELYGSKNVSKTTPIMHWGFELNGDGWFSIIDALSATLVTLEPDIEIKQVKEKFGGLRVYIAGSSEAAQAAIDVAVQFSERICEVTGHPGEGGKDAGHHRTLSPELWAEKGRGNRNIVKFFSGDEDGSSWPPRPQRLKRRLTFTRQQAVEELRRLHPRSLAKTKIIDIPPKMFDLADVALCQMSQRRHDDPDGAVVTMEEIFWTSHEGLVIVPWFPSISPVASARIAQDRRDSEKAGRPFEEPLLNEVMAEIANELRGAALFAQAMGQVIDPDTGACGPVNDRGIVHRISTDARADVDRMGNTQQVLALLHAFHSPDNLLPTVITRRSVKLTLEARHLVAKKLRDRDWLVIAPRVYTSGSIFDMGEDLPSAYHAAVGLALQYRWRLILPAEMAQFLMGRIPRPDPREIKVFHYDQPDERHYEQLGLTLKPVPDARLLDLNPAGQAIWQHVHQAPQLTQLELLKDSNFAASAWFSSGALAAWLKIEEKSGRLEGQELILARAIIAASTKATGVADKAPPDFNPAEHETSAVRIYGWAVHKHRGASFLVAELVKNHPLIADNDSLGHSSPLVWLDEQAGWARTRSRYYRLMGERRM